MIRTSYGRPRNSGYGGFPSTKPVEEGKEYDVTITETSRRGDGVAKIQGFVIFVTGGTVGQKARIKVDRVSNRFASASVVSGEGSSAEPSAPESAEPSAPESAEPSAPESAEPSAPESAEPSAPESAEPSAPESAEPSAPESAEPSAPESEETEPKSEETQS